MKPSAVDRTLLAAALVLAVLVVGASGLSFDRKVDSFQPLGFTARLEGGSWLVSEVSSGGTSLEPGDRILTVNGETFARRGDLAGSLQRRPTSRLLVQRGDRLEEIDYRAPRLDLDFPYLILSLIGAGYLLIGCYTLLKDRRRPAQIFFLWCVTSTVLYVVTPTPPFDAAYQGLYLLDEVARLFLAPLTLHLFLVFPSRLDDRRWLRRVLPFVYLPAVVLLTLQLDLMSGWRGLSGPTIAAALETLDLLELLHLAGFALLAIAALVVRLRRTQRQEHQRQVAWIVVGMAGGYAPFLLLYLVPRAAGIAWPELLTSLAVLPLAFVPVTFAYAILRYKLWDIGVVVRDTISMTLTLLLGIFGFSLANLLVSRLVPADLTYARNLIVFAAGLLIAGVLIPTRRGIGQGLERLQYGSSYGRRRALLDLGRELLEERDLDRLCAKLLTQLEEGLDLERANLLLLEREALIPVRPERGLPHQIPADAVADDLWRAEVHGLSGVRLPAVELDPEQRLFSLGYRYAFPLTLRDGRVGLVLTGYKAEGLPLSSDDTDLIRSLLNQAALAIENANLLDRVRHQLDEVVRLQRFSQNIIESSPAGIAVLDRDDSVVSCNLAFAALVGRERSGVAGRGLHELLPLESLPQPGEGMLEASYTDAEGRPRYLQLTAAPLEENRANALRIIMVQDVTDRIEMENALKEKERLAALGMLAAGVAHEVNTPITGISSYAQMLLAETAADDPRRELLEKVERETFRAARIVNNLLDFARDRTRDQRPVTLTPVITECLELLRERIAQRGIEVRWSPPSDEAQVRGNEGELQQVFSNLILNAVDALPAEGGGCLSLSVEADAEWVRATVEDDGLGIPADELSRIFQPFYSTKLGEGGTGLGLSISYNIIRYHGGKIRVVSHAGEGSRFVVELPRFRPSQGKK